MLCICYNAADLLVNPTQFDNLPATIQEALVCGTPVVASNVGGVSDLVRHRENGYLARLDALQEFADGVLCLLSDHVLWRRLSDNARQAAIRGYHDESIAQSMVAIYEEETVRRDKILPA